MDPALGQVMIFLLKIWKSGNLTNGPWKLHIPPIILEKIMEKHAMSPACFCTNLFSAPVELFVMRKPRHTNVDPNPRACRRSKVVAERKLRRLRPWRLETYGQSYV